MDDQFIRHGSSSATPAQQHNAGESIVTMDRETLLTQASSFKSLDQAFRWAVAQTPRIVPDDVVIQDEYTHDVLFRAADDTYLVFDTT
jgi:hypothetical protein